MLNSHFIAIQSGQFWGFTLTISRISQITNDDRTSHRHNRFKKTVIPRCKPAWCRMTFQCSPDQVTFNRFVHIRCRDTWSILIRVLTVGLTPTGKNVSSPFKWAQHAGFCLPLFTKSSQGIVHDSLSHLTGIAKILVQLLDFLLQCLHVLRAFLTHSTERQLECVSLGVCSNRTK